MNKFTIQQLQQMRESEDCVEFKADEGGNVSYDGRGKTNPKVLIQQSGLLVAIVGEKTTGSGIFRWHFIAFSTKTHLYL